MNETERLQVVVPKKLAGKLRKRVPARKRSAWIVEAIEDRLTAESRIEAIDRSFGTWTDEDFPGLDTAEDIKAWRASLWGGGGEETQRKPARRPASGNKPRPRSD